MNSLLYNVDIIFMEERFRLTTLFCFSGIENLRNLFEKKL